MKKDEPQIPLVELIRLAQLARVKGAAGGNPVDVWFGARCPECQEFCVFDKANAIYGTMECAGCQHIFPFTEGILLTVSRKDVEVKLESTDRSRDN